ncbi:MAG: hypothetical protein IPI67_06670 [Myxococcales bacterium]|nr:hypothetical protein [Myxococcales bacterium]
MPAKEPKAATTRRQLRTIRQVLGRLQTKCKERYDAEEETNFFSIVVDEGDPLAEAHLVHYPGLVAIYGVFAIKPAKRHRAELLAFANAFNAALHQGTAVVRSDGRLVYRAAVSYRKVKDLDPGYVAGLIADLFSVIDLIDLPLILVAKGKTARAAIKATWDGSEEARFALPS